MRKYHLLM